MLRIILVYLQLMRYNCHMDTPRTMITFKSNGIRFTYRVGGVIIQNEHVLCQAVPDEGFFFLPGGRAELGESASSSILREMEEELGVLMHIERLLYVVENFYTEPIDSSHELGLYFLMSVPGDSYLNHSLEPFERVDEAGYLLRFEWLPLAELETLPLYPQILQKALQEIPEITMHLEDHRSRFDDLEDS